MIVLVSWFICEFTSQVIKDNSIVEKYSVIIGQHFASIQDFNSAEKLYSQAGMHKEAVEMYNKAGNYAFLLSSSTGSFF